MKTFKLICCFFFLVCMTSYLSPAIANNLDTEHSIVEDKKAQFPGGHAKMLAWIKENLRTPEQDVRYGIVRIEFTVKKNGKCTGFTVKKGINKEMDLSAVECLQGMPFWEPAIVGGKKANSIVTIPVKFSSKEE